MATRAKGYTASAAFKKGSVWETPVQCGALDGFPILSSSLVSNVELIRDESFNGSAFQYPGDAGNETIEGDVATNLKFFSKEWQLIAMLMGASVETGTGDITHTMTMTAANDGLFGTLLLGLGFEIWEHANVKPIKWELSTDGESTFVKSVVNLLGYTRNINTSSGTNTVTTFASVTNSFALKEMLRFGQLSIHMNDADGADFHPTNDLLCVTEMTMSLERAAESDRTTCTLGKYNEPSDNGFATVTGSLVIPAYEDGMRTLIDDAQDKVVKKARFTFTKDTNESLTLYFPAVQLTNDGPTPDNPGKLPMTLTMDSFRNPAGAPTGMAHDNFYMVLETSDTNADRNLITWV